MLKINMSSFGIQLSCVVDILLLKYRDKTVNNCRSTLQSKYCLNLKEGKKSNIKSLKMTLLSI